MGVLTYILGRSGTGKSHSLIHCDPKSFALVNVQGKPLPFKGGDAFDITTTDKSDEICKAIKNYAEKGYKAIIVDDYQYVMANEFMRRCDEKGYDKFTEIGRHAWDIANIVRELPNDVIVYVMCHIEQDDNGGEKIKTIGKLLDEKICLEGMSSIVLKTNVSDGQYTFCTQNNGKDTVKSPDGMFPSYAILNDLAYVDVKIRDFYGFDEYSRDSIEYLDSIVKTDVEAPKPKTSRRAKKEEKVAKERAEFIEKDAEEHKDDGDAIPFPPVEEEDVPKRKNRKADEPKVEEAPVDDEPKAPRRRRRRTE